MSVNLSADSRLRFAIVVIAYNRINSLQRLVRSLLAADYLGDDVDLVLSLDCSGVQAVNDFACGVVWPFGEKRVIQHKTRLGLKKHVLKCGELTQDYKAVCVLEDDLFVSPDFYSFSKAAVDHYSSNDLIAGISLYSHLWNPYVNKPFSPLEDGFDVYFMQIASSWGQVWTREKWLHFLQWMDGRTDESLFIQDLPKEVASWSPKSWLKFHNAYLVEADKYFVYPRQSLTTNFSDPGEHAVGSTTYQVPLLLGHRHSYCFPTPEKLPQIYDAFFENKRLAAVLGIDPSEVDISLYGNRPFSKRYVLTTQRLNCAILRKFGLNVRPIDANVVLGVEGESIFLYDTETTETNSYKNDEIGRISYDLRSTDRKGLLRLACMLYFSAAIRRAKHIWS